MLLKSNKIVLINIVLFLSIYMESYQPNKKAVQDDLEELFKKMSINDFDQKEYGATNNFRVTGEPNRCYGVPQSNYSPKNKFLTIRPVNDDDSGKNENTLN